MTLFRRAAWFIFPFFLDFPCVLHSQSQDPQRAQLEDLRNKLDIVPSEVADIQTQMKVLQVNAAPPPSFRTQHCREKICPAVRSYE